MEAAEGGGAGWAAAPHQSESERRLWAALVWSGAECLLLTGVMFGFGSLELALRRDGVYAELCAEPDSGGCEAQALRLSLVYTVGAAAVPGAMMVWGPAIDLYGARRTRVLSALVVALGAAAFAASDSEARDLYALGAALLSGGGGGFFLSHFVLAEHCMARRTAFGVAHSLLNTAFDSATVCFALVELAHRHGAPLSALFAALAAFAVLAALVTPLFGELLDPPPGHQQQPAEEEQPKEEHTRFGARLDVTHLPFSRQVRTRHFAFVGTWALLTIYRTMLLLGSIGEQMADVAGSDAGAERNVRLFGVLILVSTVVSPAFGRLVDRAGCALTFAIVNCLGVLCYTLLSSGEEAALPVSFLAFGCFRAFNYIVLTVFVQGVFGNASFGRIYGVAIGILAATAAFLQYPTMALALGPLDGSFAGLNAAIALLGVPLFAFPLWIHANGGGIRGKTDEPAADDGAQL